MRALKARFDGKEIKIPKELQSAPPGEVIVIVEGPEREHNKEASSWLKAQERAFAEVWDNDEDAVYDAL
ncbi:MAG TPA: hypothetical protein VGZ47_05930 [Gemmataceae bacterium]|jgi:hypothetical protein|nr:hypothetical protein [Gemmataceae bacterium]